MQRESYEMPLQLGDGDLSPGVKLCLKITSSRLDAMSAEDRESLLKIAHLEVDIWLASVSVKH